MTSAKFNLIRFIRMGSFGALIHAPVGHVFYRKLEKQFPGSSRSAVAKKVLVDQLLWAPLLALLLFSYSGLLAGHSLPATVAAIKTSKSVWAYYAASSLLLWPAAHYVNFTAVPPNKRLLFINSVQVFFNTIVAGLAATFVVGIAA
jgi:protein Mpv17